jgi:hypothetical protein
MKIQRIAIDFAPQARNPRRSGRLIFIVGFVSAAAAAIVCANAWSKQRDALRELAAIESREVGSARVERPLALTPTDIARERAAQQVERELQTPWAELLAAFESAPRQAVALLAIEPSTSQQAVRVTAEAKDADAMLAYLGALQSDARLRRVVILSHQIQEQAAGMPLRFQIQAGWGGAKP